MATQTGTLKAGNQLVIDSQGESVDYDVSVTGYAVDFKRIQQKNTLSLGPHKVDCSYSVTVISGSPSIYKVQPNGQREYTADTLPDPATLGAGETVVVDGIVKQSNGQYVYAVDGSDRWTDKSLVIISDSRGAQGVLKYSASDVGVSAYRSTSIGFSGWMQYLSKQMFQRVVMSARPSRRAQQLANNDTSASPLDTLQIAVINPKSSDALIYIGINDIVAGRTGEQLASDIITIVKAARTSGKRVTVLLDTLRVSLTSAQQTEWMIHANLMHSYAAAGEFYLVDVSKDFIDWTTTASLQAKATMYYDGTHPNTLGAYVIGKAVSDHYKAITVNGVARRLPYINARSNDHRNNNMVENSGFATNLNGWFTAGPSGLVTALAATRIPSPDGYGFAMAVDVTVSAATHVNLTLGNFVNSPAYVAGDSIYGEVGVSVVGNGGTGNQAGVACPWVRLDLANNALGYARQYDLWPEQTANAQAITGNFEGVARTMPYVFTGNETSLMNQLIVGAYFASAGSARFIITNPQVIKNSTPYKSDEWLVQ